MNALQHLNLLLRYDRALSLRHAIQQTIRPGCRVLDAGCGVGILSFWAAQAGAAEVFAVDIEGLELAQALARENDAHDTIQFVQSDLWSLDLAAREQSFDVILAMVYLNDPRRDERQSELVYSLRDRYLRPGGRMIPDRVRYLARACDWPSQDHVTRWGGVEARIAEIEGRYGLRLGALGERIAGEPWKTSFPPRRADGRLDLNDARILSDPTTFAEIDYRRSPTPYPAEFDVAATAPGVFNTLLWTQELWSEEQLLFSNESVSWLAGARQVEAGGHFTVGINEDWRRLNLATATASAPILV